MLSRYECKNHMTRIRRKNPALVEAEDGLCRLDNCVCISSLAYQKFIGRHFMVRTFKQVKEFSSSNFVPLIQSKFHFVVSISFWSFEAKSSVFALFSKSTTSLHDLKYFLKRPRAYKSVYSCLKEGKYLRLLNIRRWRVTLLTYDD